GFTHLFSEQLSARAFATFERSRIEDSFGRRDFMMAGLDTALTWDSRDNAADATRGFYLQATAFPFHEFQYANTAVRATGEARAYQKIDAEGRAVLAGRVMVGMLAGVPIAQAPPDKLFFAGGGGSVRGYSYKSIGLGQRRNLKGGLSVFEASVEARVKVTDTIGLVAFADAGTVGPDIVPDFKRMLYGAGLGLRYYTGLGPIRLDVAMPLNRRRGDSSFAFYAGIGQAF
ncbi:MAG: BamA/TamA family outer membrane protein, partial [Notoacmeibacter sp.]|nr:BamA/TamA family outer membrane protein [Notoacmeibacter sp.]